MICINSKHILIQFFILLLVSSGCSKTGNNEIENIKSDKDFTVAVLNEGNYTWGNASLTLINEDSGTISQNHFEVINNAPLGDVAQSFIKWNGRIYVVVNNSGKIEELDVETWKRKRTLSNLVSPRYILPVGNQKAYVSDLYANAIHIIDLETFTKTGKIPMDGWTEQIIFGFNTAWVIEVDNKMLKAIDTENDKVIDSIPLDASPNSMLQLESNQLYVLASNENESSSYFYQIDGHDRSILDNPFVLDGTCNNLRSDGNGYLYYIKNSSEVYRSLNTNIDNKELILDLNGRNIYGFETIGEYLYLCDAKDYTRNGVLLKYTLSDNPVLVDSFITGRIPQAIMALP